MICHRCGKQKWTSTTPPMPLCKCDTHRCQDCGHEHIGGGNYCGLVGCHCDRFVPERSVQS